MSSRRHDAFSWIVGMFCLALVALGFVGPGLLAQESEPSSPPAETGPITNDDYRPFQLYPSDPGALTWEDLRAGPAPAPEFDGEVWVSPERYLELTADSQQSALDLQAWAQIEHNDTVLQAYSDYSAFMVEQALLRRAEYEAGLAGIGQAGVE